MFQGSCAQQQTAILKIALHEENKSGVDLLCNLLYTIPFHLRKGKGSCCIVAPFSFYTLNSARMFFKPKELLHLLAYFP
jgi:hypothetical protein